MFKNLISMVFEKSGFMRCGLFKSFDFVRIFYDLYKISDEMLSIF